MPGQGRFKNIGSWPEADRTRWQRGLAPTSLLDRTGHAAKWRPETATKNARGWGTYLNWLDATGQLSAYELPEQRIAPQRIKSYCAYLEDSVRPTTVRSRLNDLVLALGVLAPQADAAYIRRLRCLYPKQGDALAKRARMREFAVLLQLGLDLMARAGDLSDLGASICYRDGLIIAVLSCRALRLRNLTNIEIAHHLTQIDEKWSLLFTPKETKTHRSWTSTWPELLVSHLDRYLALHRPTLLGSHAHHSDSLWISARSGPLTKRGIYLAIIKRTKAAFGEFVNPHLFRDFVATSLAVHDPASVQLSRHVLGHARYDTTQSVYNQARCLEASSSLNETLQRLRR